MADGELILKLDDDTARRLRAAADAVGRPVEAYAAELISGGLDDDWADEVRAAQEYDRTGEHLSVEEGLSIFRSAVEDQLAKRR